MLRDGDGRLGLGSVLTVTKGTNGGCLMWRGVCLKAWSTTQGAVALSSGEALY